MPRQEFLYSTTMNPSINTFVANSILWLSNGNSDTIIATHMEEQVGKHILPKYNFFSLHRRNVKMKKTTFFQLQIGFFSKNNTVNSSNVFCVAMLN
jgi:hypothetical protein